MKILRILIILVLAVVCDSILYLSGLFDDSCTLSESVKTKLIFLLLVYGATLAYTGKFTASEEKPDFNDLIIILISSGFNVSIILYVLTLGDIFDFNSFVGVKVATLVLSYGTVLPLAPKLNRFQIDLAFWKSVSKLCFALLTGTVMLFLGTNGELFDFSSLVEWKIATLAFVYGISTVVFVRTLF